MWFNIFARISDPEFVKATFPPQPGGIPINPNIQPGLPPGPLPPGQLSPGPGQPGELSPGPGQPGELLR